VTAWAILKDGKQAGKVIANWSDNPAGSVCSLAIIGFGEPGDHTISICNGQVVGKARGYGYCKFSSAFASCLRLNGIETEERLGGVGEGACRAWLESEGYTVAEVI